MSDIDKIRGGNMKEQLFFSQNIKQDQRLIMSYAMKRAFHVLQLPTDELANFLEEEVEKNPVLHLNASSAKEFDPSLTPSKPSLYEHLETEISHHFSSKEEKEIAKYLAGSLDHKGLLTLGDEELKGKEEVLLVFQQMHPKGIGARSIQEALLLQLDEKSHPLAYRLIKHHYKDLLHLRLQKIGAEMKLGVDEVKTLIQKEIRPLSPFPASGFETEINPILVPDVTITKEDEVWSVDVNDSLIPTFQIHPTYLDYLEKASLKNDEISFIRRHLASGKWLLRAVDRRKKTLLEIASYLLKKEKDYLDGKTSAPMPLTMKEVAKALALSESTITRAIANKSLATPRGLLTFKSFFSNALSAANGAVSTSEAKILLQKLIQNETTPLSDEELSKKLLDQGVKCARRTVAKYRKELKIGSASERKLWKP